ncbi:uncharacterized protein LOC115695107 [Cannabis sativa]|uniref:uncharacterized protein LOC115695107 n=1 Tax=Cannabis sativa TaxID=3483 RepID=UPI0011E03D35|nr:uncharacterized protein LOC115695107 [Cannabis sativa]
MDFQGVRGDVSCRIFPVTLSETVKQRYFKLAPGKLKSWKAFSSEFHAQFSSSRQIPLHLGDLVNVKKRPGEPLRAYNSRFMTEATKVSRVIEDGKLGYSQAEGEQKPDKSKAPSTGMSAQLPRYPNNLSSNGKRSNNNRQGNGKKGKFTDKTEEALRENQAKYTAFTIFTEDIESVYMATQSLAPYKKPRPMKKDVSKRDMTKFCQFHGGYGHDTNGCNYLKREIKFLIRKKNPHVQKYVKID